MLQNDAQRGIVVSDTTVTVHDVVSSWLESAEPFLICVAVEIAAKLQYNNVVCDNQWLAQLVVAFFDSRFSSTVSDADDAEEEDVKQIGSSLRLQQLLSVFFPAFCLTSENARDSLLQSIAPLLEIVFRKQSQKKKPRGFKAFPIEKMICFVCDSVRQGDDIAEGLEKECAQEPVEKNLTGPQASIELMTAIQVARFIEKEHDAIGITFMRTLVKLLAGIDLSTGILDEPAGDVETLNSLVESLGMAVEDDSCIRALEGFGSILASFQVEPDGVDPERDLAESLHGMGLEENDNHRTDKENSARLSAIAKDADLEATNPRTGLSVIE